MKRILLSFITLIISTSVYAQFGFQSHVVTNEKKTTDGPVSVFSVDLDNDGDLDILSALYDDDNIVWYRNEDGLGNFGFQQLLINTVPFEKPSYAFPSDIDGDGDMDVVAVNDQISNSDIDSVVWFENLDGNGTFGPKQIISTSVSSPRSVFADDIDGDGDTDVISASLVDGKVAWYRNLDGNGNFSDQIVVASVASAKHVILADLDGDNDKDIVFTKDSNFGKVSWLENLDGLGNFGTEIIISSYNFDGYTSVFPIDIDGDLDFDLVFSYSSRIAWAENTDGLGTFGDTQEITDQASQASSVYAADFDNDGDMDVVSASENDNKIAWYENLDGLGVFGSQNIITNKSIETLTVFASDIDSDNDIDIISASFEDSKIEWHKNTNGLGEFSLPIAVSKSTRRATSVFSGDLNGDGLVDLISTSQSDSKLAWYPSNLENEDYSTQYIISDISGPQWGFASDLDNDGDLDIAIKSSLSFLWLENSDGAGDFLLRETLSGNSNFALPIDIDADLDTDIIVCDDNSIGLLEHVNGGIFTYFELFDDSSFEFRNLALEDMDADGDVDIMATSELGRIVWFENINNFSSTNLNYIAILSGANLLRLEDIDNDGDNDIVCTSNGSSSVDIVIYENNGGVANYGDAIVIGDNVQSLEDLVVVDIDSDSFKDLVYNSSGFESLVWRKNLGGFGNFGPETVIADYNASGPIVDINFADLDGDTDMDLISAGLWSDKVTWYENILEQEGNFIQGTVIVNTDNTTCLANTNSVYGSNLLISVLSNGESLSTFTDQIGHYILPVGEGDYSTKAERLPVHFASSPIENLSSFNSLGNIDIADFCLEATSVVNDIETSIYPLFDPRPGFETSYRIVYTNKGTLPELSGTISFEYDDMVLDFISASETVVSEGTNILYFNFEDLDVLEAQFIDLVFYVLPPPSVNTGDLLDFFAIVDSGNLDITPFNNSHGIKQTIVNSFDPNDISVVEGPEIFIEDADKDLHYIIRFQNTGSASAININVEHKLDEKLDWQSMQLEGLSHTGRVEIIDGSMVNFVFNNIQLPDSTSNEPESHGYIAFKIKPKSDVAIGDIISGTADIFFDFNPPITTNTVNTEIVAPLSVGEFNAQSIQVHPNPVKTKLEITSSQVIDKLTVIDINGRLLKAIKLSNLEYNLDVSSLAKGVYFMEIYSGNSSSTKKFIKN